MNKIKKLAAAFIISAACCGSLNAASFFSPVPAPVSAVAGIDFSRNLYSQGCLEISLNLSPGIYFSIFPAAGFPAVSAGTGISLSFFFDEKYEGLFLAADADLNLYLNPFIYNSNLQFIDLLAAAEAELSTGWRFSIEENLCIAPRAGGRFSISGSLTSFTDLFCYTGLFAEINLIIKF